jgi:hypothetical protein
VGNTTGGEEPSGRKVHSICFQLREKLMNEIPNNEGINIALLIAGII